MDVARRFAAQLSSRRAGLRRRRDMNCEIGRMPCTRRQLPGSLLLGISSLLCSSLAMSEEDTSSGTTMDVYGFAMMDTGYQSNQNDPDWFDVVRPTKLPSFEN